MISFQNTEIAFRSKTDNELQRAYILFNTLGKSFYIKAGKFLVRIANRIHFPIGWAVKPIYKHFVGGIDIQSCIQSVRNLEKFNVKAIIDYSVEGGKTQEDIKNAMVETLNSIENAANDSNIPFSVFKPTAFAAEGILEKVSSGVILTEYEQIEFDGFKARVDLLCKTAFEKNIPILIDAEDFAYQKCIDEVVTLMMQKYNKEKAIVFNTLQMYRIDRLNYLKELIKKATDENYYIGIKFVRGAYMEKERERALKMNYPSPIQPDKDCTDRDFNLALEYSIENIDRITIFNGTHNEHSNLLLIELMKKYHIANNDNRIWFAQLYGMSDHISFNLAAEGYNVAKYVPYGPVKHVIPYLIRRAEENSSIAGQTGRELNLIKLEKKRRNDTNAYKNK